MNITLVLLAGIFEVLIIYNYWFSLLEKRYSRKFSLIVYSTVMVVNTVKCMLMMDMVAIKSFTTILIFFILIHFLFKDPIPKKLVVHITYMLCSFFAESIAIVLAKYAYNYDMKNFLDDSLPCLMWQISAYLFLFLFTVIGLLLLKHKKIDIENKITQYIYIFISVQCILAFCYIMLLFNYKITSTLMFIAIGIVVLASVAICCLIYKTIKTVTKRYYEVQYMEMDMKIKDKHFAQIKEQYAEYRRLKHDFSNHIKIINELNDSKELKDYVSNISDKFARMDQASYCDNLTLDALLTIKANEARQNSLNTEFRICSLNGISVSDFDLCVISSNLIDNAFEAAMQTNEKQVALTITRKSDRLIIKSVNSSPERDTSLTTTKSDSENHGIGIENIKKIAGKYNGDTAFVYENSSFTSIVNLPCENTEQEK